MKYSTQLAVAYPEFNHEYSLYLLLYFPSIWTLPYIQNIYPCITALLKSYCVQNGSVAHPASYPMGSRGSFPGGKEAGEWNWPLTSI
jgi:hypothetical protein